MPDRQAAARASDPAGQDGSGAPSTAAGLIPHAADAGAARLDQDAAALPGSGAAAWPGLSRWWSLLVAFLAGGSLAGAFPPIGFWPLAIAGPALLTLAVWGKRYAVTFILTLTCGLVFFVGLLSWLINVAWYAWFALAVAEALTMAVLALALPQLLRLRFWPLPVAGWWVVVEAVHDRWPSSDLACSRWRSGASGTQRRSS